jgi:hypothetical protein
MKRPGRGRPPRPSASQQAASPLQASGHHAAPLLRALCRPSSPVLCLSNSGTRRMGGAGCEWVGWARGRGCCGKLQGLFGGVWGCFFDDLRRWFAFLFPSLFTHPPAPSAEQLCLPGSSACRDAAAARAGRRPAKRAERAQRDGRGAGALVDLPDAHRDRQRPAIAAGRRAAAVWTGVQCGRTARLRRRSARARLGAAGVQADGEAAQEAAGGVRVGWRLQLQGHPCGVFGRAHQRRSGGARRALAADLHSLALQHPALARRATRMSMARPGTAHSTALLSCHAHPPASFTPTPPHAPTPPPCARRRS